MKKFIQSWIISALAVLVAVYVVKGIHYTKPLDLAVAALLLGILNAVLRPFLTLLTLPLLIFTFGLFRLVINALLLYLVGYLLQPDFRVDDFWSAFWGALIISLITRLAERADRRWRFPCPRCPPWTSERCGPRRRRSRD